MHIPENYLSPMTCVAMGAVMLPIWYKAVKEVKVKVDTDKNVKVLIIGKGSYIGESFKTYANKNYTTSFEIDEVDTINPDWKDMDFSVYDIVYHVAG